MRILARITPLLVIAVAITVLIAFVFAPVAVMAAGTAWPWFTKSPQARTHAEFHKQLTENRGFRFKGVEVYGRALGESVPIGASATSISAFFSPINKKLKVVSCNAKLLASFEIAGLDKTGNPVWSSRRKACYKDEQFVMYRNGDGSLTPLVSLACGNPLREKDASARAAATKLPKPKKGDPWLRVRFIEKKSLSKKAQARILELQNDEDPDNDPADKASSVSRYVDAVFKRERKTGTARTIDRCINAYFYFPGVKKRKLIKACPGDRKKRPKSVYASRKVPRDSLASGDAVFAVAVNAPKGCVIVSPRESIYRGDYYLATRGNELKDMATSKLPSKSLNVLLDCDDPAS